VADINDGMPACDNNRYSVLVTDPPWPLAIGSKRTARSTSKTWNAHHDVRPLPYPTMTLEAIAALPVDELCAEDAHLWIWTVNRFVEQTYEIVREWGFKPPGQLCTWAKAPMGLGPGGAFAQTSEHFLFVRRGKAPHLTRVDRTVFDWKRPYGPDGKPAHSAKPDAFYDLVDTVSPGRRLEMFSRAARLGWDTWGNESLHGGVAV
jgi:N6-adenosine-specific RNA methylase IME4